MTARSLLWDGLVIGAAFTVILLGAGGVAVACAMIGTTAKPELRPVLAARAQLTRLTRWTRRLPVTGLLYPSRGDHRRIIEGDHHEGQEPAGDGRMRGLRAPAPRLDAGEMPSARGGDRPHGVVPGRGRDGLRAEDPDDLTGLSAEDTGTLRAIREINAEHLVPVHEPPASGPGGLTASPPLAAAGDTPGPGDALDALIEAARQQTSTAP